MSIIAKILIEQNCLKLSPREPFTYASGLKGPIYCDNRLLMGNVEARKVIIDEFAKLAAPLKFDVILGLATAGIAHGAWLAENLKMPFGYVRSKAKEHGKQSQIEGIEVAGQNALLVEDLVNQGASLNKALNCVKQGLKCTDVFSIVDYQMKPAQEVLKNHKVKLHSLCSFEDIINTAKDFASLTSQDVEMLLRWHRNPEQWSQETK